MPTTTSKAHKVTDAFVIYVICVLYTWSISFAVLSCTLITHSIFGVLMGSLVWVALFTLVFLNKYTLIISAALVLFTLLFLFFGHMLGSESSMTIIEYYQDVVFFVLGYQGYSPSFSPTIVITLTAVVSLISVVFIKVVFQPLTSRLT